MRRRGLAALAGALVLLAASAPGAAAASQQIQLVLPLRADLAGLERVAAAVATPGSPDYGQYASVSRLATRFGASPSTRRRVLAYLRRVGATAVRVDATGLFAVATMRASLAARLFATSLELARAAGGTRYLTPRSAASVPAPLAGLVTGVVGLSTRPLATPPQRAVRTPRAAQATSAYQPATGTPAGCRQEKQTGGFTPNQYLTAYRFDPLQRAGFDGQGERVALIEIDGFRSSDITTFARCFGLHVPHINAFGVGVNRPLSPGAEATLDVEVLDAAAPHLAGIDVYETVSDAAGSLQAFAAPFENPGFKPQVISASLGLCEPDIAGALGSSGIRTAEAEFEMAAASGITVLASSGDTGSADCIGTRGVPRDVLAVNFPASSPWVTGVGGTNLALNPANTIDTEIVWNDTSAAPGSAGGGGESALFARPSYQNGVVAGNGRAVPDVAMLSDIAPGYAVYCTAPECTSGGTPAYQSVGGTSAATPLLGGGIALIDQELRQRQQADLGRLNPLLYRLGAAHDSVFDDVTEFGNDVGPYIPGNHQPLGCCTAAPGYDEASGWGSVNVARLASIALATQPKTATVSLSLPAHQRPVADHQIIAWVSCSRACLLGAFAEISIDRGRPFVVGSKDFRLRHAGSRMVAIELSSSQLGPLRAALAHRRPIVATVYAVTLSAPADIQRETSGAPLRIRA